MLTDDQMLFIHREISTKGEARLKEFMAFLEFDTVKDMQHTTIAEHLEGYMITMYQFGFADGNSYEEK